MASAAIDHNKNSSSIFKMLFAASNQLHGASGPFLYGSVSNVDPSLNATLAEVLTNYYISFVVTSDPNPLRDYRAIFWPSYASNGRGDRSTGESVGFPVLKITDTSFQALSDSDVSPQCDFWSSHGRETGS